MPEVLYSWELTLNAGEDRATDPFRLDEGSEVELDCVGTTRFYASLVTSDYFDTALRGPGGTFPFRFTTDRSTFLQRYKVTQTRYYRVVLRISAYNRKGTIQVRLTKLP